MGALVVQQNVSIDGYAADSSGEATFVAAPGDWRSIDSEEERWLAGVDRILLGATTYRLFAAFWPQETEELIADRLNRTPKSVFSSTLVDAPWGDWAPARIERGDVVQRIAAIKAETAGDLVLWGSLRLMRTALAAGLVDRVELRVMPVVMGAGVPTFDAPLDAELVSSARHGDIVVLDYRMRPPR
ncbi:dihydrofolate reductase family protein [Herbiconiux sp. L3-i23]|uniref:dihydrofolate reductase family protein n=1 Tax=Herbiconiux sp. L3-i23 TaxID=2905871 RepID=UPI0020521AE2|nr:dihydrofolate reductase family protein [Herbiconiux sp. L3-i23]BDI22673.1 deaminase reductase [Herbiconiux sp. L3-i23]